MLARLAETHPAPHQPRPHVCSNKLLISKCREHVISRESVSSGGGVSATRFVIFVVFPLIHSGRCEGTF